MTDTIINAILNMFGGADNITSGKEILVFIVSLFPILELRGGLLLAGALHLDPIRSYIISIIGNLIPVPFILLLMNRILGWMRNCKIKFINNFAKWLDGKVEKHKAQIEKYGYLGLILFVGIPLPGTGAWTGSLLASALELNRKKSFLMIIIGVFIASIIMMLLSFGFVARVMPA